MAVMPPPLENEDNRRYQSTISTSPHVRSNKESEVRRKLLQVTQCVGGKCFVVNTSTRKRRPLAEEAAELGLQLPRNKRSRVDTSYDEAQTLKQRQNVVAQLTTRVARAQKEGRMPSKLPAAAVAKGLEKALFSASASLQDHFNLETLDSRLNRMVKTLEEKKRRKQQHDLSSVDSSTSSHNPNDPDGAVARPPLSVAVGVSATTAAVAAATQNMTPQERFLRTRRVQRIVQEAQVQRFSWAERTKCGQAMPYRSALPEPVKKFFFKTRLLTTQLPSYLIPEELILEAEANMKAYREWAAVNLPCLLTCQGGASCSRAKTQQEQVVSPNSSNNHREEIQKAFENPRAVVIDVRQPSEITTRVDVAKSGCQWINAPGNMVNCPDLSYSSDEILPDKTVPIILYCASGQRSQKAMDILQKQGYTNVWNAGGIANPTFALPTISLV